ncbi:MAG: MBOAT family protein, partial [Eubacterium sp.]|nr:MBOAT family protein [Eubacterium sp.]
ENFRYPFISENIAEFWQRWHISLGSFFRDYLLYIPLFGKRRKYASLFLVWFCTGLWHGASWNYVLWGLYFGLFMFIEMKIGKKRMKKWPKVLKHVYTLAFVAMSFGLHYFTELPQIGQFFLNVTGINTIMGNAGVADILTWNSFKSNIPMIIIAVAASLPILPKIREWITVRKDVQVLTFSKVGGMIACACLFAVCAILLVNSTNHPFMYWQF